MQETVSKQQPKGDLTSASPAFSSLPENNLINVIKVRKLQLVWVFFGGVMGFFCCFLSVFSKKPGVLIYAWACFVSRWYPGVSASHPAGLLQTSVFPFSRLPLASLATAQFHRLSFPAVALYQTSLLPRVQETINFCIRVGMGRGVDVGWYVLCCLGVLVQLSEVCDQVLCGTR